MQTQEYLEDFFHIPCLHFKSLGFGSGHGKWCVGFGSLPNSLQEYFEFLS
jgi:hypothetical protein